MMLTDNIKILPGLFYIIAQIFGSLVAAVMVYLLAPNGRPEYRYDSTFPTIKNSDVNGSDMNYYIKACVAEFFATFFLVFMVFGTAVDKRASPGVFGMAIGGVVACSAISIGS